MFSTENSNESSISFIESRKLLEKRSLELKIHSVFGSVRSSEDLQCFMTWHVFAVWDFMSLVKRLQYEFTSVSLPWTPPIRPSAARLLNEIVLGEESDLLPNGMYASHFELYLSSMKEVGADTSQIEHFVALVRANISVETALRIVKAPAPIKKFVLSTMESAKTGSVSEVLGSFLYGREDVIPQMFKTLLSDWAVPEESTPTFVYYLQRHIELDGDTHGPAAKRLAEDLAMGNEELLNEIHLAGITAIEHRIELWNALKEEMTCSGNLSNTIAPL